MFSSQMKEAKDMEIKIDDVEPATIKDMLEFMYSDKVVLHSGNNQHVFSKKIFLLFNQIEELDLQRTINLLPVSEKYNISGLSAFCIAAISQNLDVDRAPEVAALADQLQVQPLLDLTVYSHLQ